MNTKSILKNNQVAENNQVLVKMPSTSLVPLQKKKKTL